MAEIKKYVDWDGLVYYDGKSKQYIDDKFDSCLKVGGSVAFSDLPSPSANNLNYIFKITDSFVSNEYFEKPGYEYNAGTVVQVTDLERIYLYTIFYEPNSTSTDVEETISNLQERMDIIEQTAVTKKDLEDATTIQDSAGEKVDVVAKVKVMTEDVEILKNEIEILKDPLVYGEW